MTSLTAPSARTEQAGLRPFLLSWLATFAVATLTSPAWAGSPLTVFESGPVRPVALSPQGNRLFVTNIPDATLEVFAVTDDGLVRETAVTVGLEPVAVAAVSESEAWVVNHLSDSVSIVDIGPPARVVRTLQVGDAPRDIVVAGAGGRRVFVTTAHRGQNSPVDPQFFTPGVGRADVWVFDRIALAEDPNGGVETILTLFADTPRALAATSDRTKVYAAAFHSGNATTTVVPDLVCVGGAEAGPCEPPPPIPPGLLSPGGIPAPNENFEGAPAPHTGLIVRTDPQSGRFEDELGRNWSSVIPSSLPDLDVFEIDALASTPRVTQSFAGVGTVLFNMAAHPLSGEVFVTNTEAANEVRFEPEVAGRMHRARVSIVNPATGAVDVRPLNTHIDYETVPSPPGTADASLAIPLQLAFSADGATLYLAAFGSSKVATLDATALAAGSFASNPADHIEVGGGPGGIAVDEVRGLLYVYLRFDNEVAVVDLATRTVVQRIGLHDAEPADVKAGRSLLYDARATSSNGEASCASCHVFGDVDSLAWDLGDPGAPVVSAELPITSSADVIELQTVSFHPMKGPMTTQTLRGMATHGAMHWRGDRVGADPFDPVAALAAFNPAFVSLLGAAAPLEPADLAAFTDFVLAIVPPPNPVRALDGSLTETQAQGREDYFSLVKSPEEGTCDACHALDPDQGFFGASGVAVGIDDGSIDNNQVFKVPPLRSLYEKVGAFNFLPTCTSDCVLGPQVRGFAQGHDGASPVLPTEVDTPELFEFLMAYPSNLAPVVGQQVTVGPEADQARRARAALLAERARVGECDLIAKTAGGTAAGGTAVGDTASSVVETKGYAFDGTVFEADRRRERPRSFDEILALSEQGPVTFTCLPPGSGRRFAIDRDADAVLDGDERAAGSDPADPLEVAFRRARIVVRGVGSPAGDERLRVGGVAPAVEPFDPSSTGASVQVHDASGIPLAELALAAGEDWIEIVDARRWLFTSGSLRAVVKLKAGGRRYRMRVRAVGDFAGAASIPLRLAGGVATPVAVRDFAVTDGDSARCRETVRDVVCR